MYLTHTCPALVSPQRCPADDDKKSSATSSFVASYGSSSVLCTLPFACRHRASSSEPVHVSSCTWPERADLVHVEQIHAPHLATIPQVRAGHGTAHLRGGVGRLRGALPRTTCRSTPWRPMSGPHICWRGRAEGGVAYR
eukprot:3935803-Rhodomonas_salina.5